ncbi:MAG: hypothetical protein Q4E39_02775 [bacterium]|nr:hypothetical protein [bacterium]
MEKSLFKGSKSLKEKKKIIMKKLEECININDSILEKGIKTLNSIDETDTRFNCLLNKIDRCVDKRKSSPVKMKFLLVTTIIYKDYLKEYSNESILTLASTAFSSASYEDIELHLGDFVPKYNDKFLKEIYKRQKDFESILYDLTAMDMIYDNLLDKSRISREEKNNMLLKIYKAMSNKEVFGIENKIYENTCNNMEQYETKKMRR